MRLQIIIFIFIFGAVSVYAQKNYALDLQSSVWYQDNGLKKADNKIMVFKKLKANVDSKEKTTFKKDGTIKRCFLDQNFASNGIMGCDSSFTYTIKKDLIHISDKGILHLYYKMKSVENGLELKAIEPDRFYKK